MTEMDLKLYEFVKILRRQADEYEDIGHKEADDWLLGKAEAYFDIADMIEANFRDNLIK